MERPVDRKVIELVPRKEITRAYEKKLKVKDKILGVLNSMAQARGTREVRVTIDDLQGRTNLTYAAIYQELKRLASNQYVTLLTEPYGVGREKIVGVRLNKVGNDEQVVEETSRRAASSVEQNAERNLLRKYVHLSDYLKKKIAAEQMRNVARDNGFNPEEMVTFEPEPLGEEAILLLENVLDLINQTAKLQISLEIAQGEAERYKTLSQQHEDCS